MKTSLLYAIMLAGAVLFIYCIVGYASVGTRWQMSPPSPLKMLAALLVLTIAFLGPLMVLA